MTFIGIGLMWWALLASFAFIAVLFFALFWIADIADRHRRARPAPITLGRDVLLPRAVAIPTAHRRAHPTRWPT